MENQRTFLFIALMAIGAVLFQKWIDFSNPAQENEAVSQQTAEVDGLIPTIAQSPKPLDNEVPTIVSTQSPIVPDTEKTGAKGRIITVETDIMVAQINTVGGGIERVELKLEPVSLEQPEQGFALLQRTPTDIFITQDGLAAANKQAPNHFSQYTAEKQDYRLGEAESIVVPLRWAAENGAVFTKLVRFNKDSYLIDVEYLIDNRSNQAWEGVHYGSLLRSAPADSGSGFGRLPSHTGPAYYTQENKYAKLDFDDIESKKPISEEAKSGKLTTQDAWVAMLQHYFVAAWVPKSGQKVLDTGTKSIDDKQTYRIGYQDMQTTAVPVGATGRISTQLYIGSKEQKRLKEAEENSGIEGLALTVDYGFLTFIADPLFTVLSWIHNIVGNWGWSIILLTVLIKAIFYPLSAASYKSMAGMKKLQPRITTLKERYKDDKPKFQAEMMALYKKEKINPAGGCLPILIQIPVFISLYWALLESVEIRLAPFALWWQDLSAPDPYYVLPVLMGVSMWAQQKLNPAPMDDIQKKVMTVMPIALTFLFLTFPQGLVLYWVVNNVLSMAQQWLINKRHAT